MENLANIPSRARCVPLQNLNSQAHGVKLGPILGSATDDPSNPQLEEIVVPSHLTQGEEPPKTHYEAISGPNMDVERYQDLSGLGWFASGAPVDYPKVKTDQNVVGMDYFQAKPEPEEFYDPSLIEDTDLLFDEIGNRDLIEYIVSDNSPKNSPTQNKPNPGIFDTATLPESSSPRKEVQMRETYLAIPREVTCGDDKIPKMLILKTPEASTINLQEMGATIEERIKTGRRRKIRHYSDFSMTDDEEDDEPRRKRRISTTSTASSDRYRELRDRNNEASRRSRKNRKEKERSLMRSLEKEEEVNRRLRARADELEKRVLLLRKLLLQIVVNKGCAR